MELTYTEWDSGEPTTVPCVNGLESKGKTISGKGVDGLILKHWSTSRVHVVHSKRVTESCYVGAPPLLAASSTGDNNSVTRVKGVDLPDTCGGAIDSNLLEGDVS